MKMFRILLALFLLLGSAAALAHGFTLKDIQGKTHKLADYRGKWVMVNFWATWCQPCQQETPDLIALYNEHKDSDMVVIGVALDSTLDAIKDFVSKYRIPYPIVYGSYTMAQNEVGKVESLPTTYMYNPNGELVIRQEGAMSREEVDNYFALRKEKGL